MKLIDLHVHTKGISLCSIINGEEMAKLSLEQGIDGAVLCNHYDYCSMRNGETHFEFAKRYVEEYFNVKEEAKKLGFEIFFGIEVTMRNEKGEHILVLGVEPSFVLKYNNLHEYKLEDLHRLVNMHGGILVQAHPLRHGINAFVNPKFIDGVEANCAIHFDGPHLDEISEFAHKNSLLLTSGGDYHGDVKRYKVGLYLPDEISDTKGIVDYIISQNEYQLNLYDKENPSYVVTFSKR
jgi:hypothetical protein